MTRFQGPLFVVGMPRSGTKLLRELLNNHPEISLPPAESLFIPDFLRRFGTHLPHAPRDLQDRHDYLRSSTYLINLAQQGFSLPFDQFQVLAAPCRTSQDLIEAILKYFSLLQKPGASIWGDKSPWYRRHLPLLKTHFPAARFIHILRDPRDQVLSAWKAWGKHPYRSAQEWNRDTWATEQAGLDMGDDYVRVHFEDLLEQPEPVMRDLVSRLGLSYPGPLATQVHSHEDLGDARGSQGILHTNSGKYLQAFHANQLARIESLSLPSARYFGYLYPETTVYRPLSSFERLVLTLHDAVLTLAFHLQDKGLFRGLSYYFAIRRTR